MANGDGDSGSCPGWYEYPHIVVCVETCMGDKVKIRLPCKGKDDDPCVGKLPDTSKAS